MTVVDLTLKRLDRLEKAQHETNERLDRVVDVLEAHSRHFERMEDALLGIAARVDTVSERLDRLSGRIDRLVTAIARGRTQDLARLDDHERRLRSLERRNGRRRRKS
jgi:predicted  nucleic acid-binding Zn-ribbon protein